MRGEIYKRIASFVVSHQNIEALLKLITYVYNYINCYVKRWYCAILTSQSQSYCPSIPFFSVSDNDEYDTIQLHILMLYPFANCKKKYIYILSISSITTKYNYMYYIL